MEVIGPDLRPFSAPWHRKTAEGLKLPELLKVHAARHHWAVLSLRNGVPIAVVQRQLGHSTAKLTLDTYGAFIPQAEDRARWREHVTRAEKKRRDAMRGMATGAV